MTRRIEAEQTSKGSFEVITGPVFCGKTDELIRRLGRCVIEKKQAQVFILRMSQKREIVSHNGDKRMDATPISSSDQIKKLLNSKTNVVGIDDAHLMDDNLANVIHELNAKGVSVIVSGLDTDFKRNPFGPMGNLLAVSHKIDKLAGVCNQCGEENAAFSQRLIKSGKSFRIAPPDDPLFISSDDRKHEARCVDCYEIPQ